jgi:hypothetical protein
MTTQFRKYRDRQAKNGIQKGPGVKRSKAETLAGQIGAMKNRIRDLYFPSFTTEDREMVTEARSDQLIEYQMQSAFWEGYCSDDCGRSPLPDM